MIQFIKSTYLHFSSYLLFHAQLNSHCTSLEHQKCTFQMNGSASYCRVKYLFLSSFYISFSCVWKICRQVYKYYIWVGEKKLIKFPFHFFSANYLILYIMFIVQVWILYYEKSVLDPWPAPKRIFFSNGKFTSLCPFYVKLIIKNEVKSRIQKVQRGYDSYAMQWQSCQSISLGYVRSGIRIPVGPYLRF